MKITVEQLTSAVKATNAARAEEFVDAFNKYGEAFGITTPKRLVHFLAQVYEESGALRSVEENLNYSSQGLLKTFSRYFNSANVGQYARQPVKIANRVYANRYGNGSEASGDGWRYRGRGLIQITFKANYQACANSGFCNGDLLAHPEWLTQKPGHTKSAMWFWWHNKLNALADTDNGKNSETVVTNITWKVNGGKNGLPKRIEYYQAFRKVFGI